MGTPRDRRNVQFLCTFSARGKNAALWTPWERGLGLNPASVYPSSPWVQRAHGPQDQGGPEHALGFSTCEISKYFFESWREIRKHRGSQTLKFLSKTMVPRAQKRKIIEIYELTAQELKNRTIQVAINVLGSTAAHIF